VAEFTLSFINDRDPLTVQFTDLSGGSPYLGYGVLGIMNHLPYKTRHISMRLQEYIR